MAAIRKAMEGTESVQERLDDFVAAIFTSIQVNVASIYLIRNGDELELSATQGLKKSAVHTTRLEHGEGLVGHVAITARPLNLADAPAHPLFSYRPETGEDPYKSFLGVPILRGGRVLGVLVVQSKDAREYSEDDIEDLLTIAMLLAEIIIDDERAGGKKGALKGITLAQTKPETIRGTAFADGLAEGRAILHLEPLAIADRLSEDIPAEEARLEEGVKILRASVDAMVSGEAASLNRASKEIYETYRMFAYDRRWVGKLREAVHSGLTAEAAVERVRNENRAPNRLIRALAGEAITPGQKDLPEDAILFARDLGPAELLDYDRTSLRAIVLEEGAATSHTAIICRAIGIPLVGRAEAILDLVESGDPVLVDGESGHVYIRPLETQIHGLQLRMRIRGEVHKAFEAIKHRPAITQDDRHISLQLNAGLVVDLPQIEQSGADGIGLFRTEFQFMVSNFMPKLKEQTDLYRQAIEKAGDLPVTFRTLDLGGDKILPYMDPVPEQNPAIGWRAIRIALDRPGLMRYQLRALVAAGAGRHLRIMFPMVTTVEEFIDAKGLFKREVERASKLGARLPTKIEVGVMLETPSLAWSINQICDHADFVSVGANPASVSMLRDIAQGCHRNNVPVSVCGALAGRPLEAMVLIALGFDALSMPAIGIGPVKSAVLALNAQKLADYIKPLISQDSRLSSIREQVRKFCLDEGIPI